MTVREYIGARYVPLFMGDWDNTVSYEPLSIVSYQGNSYTSRQFVPTGIDIDNEIYWAETGNYNAQVEAYRQEVLTFDERITTNANDIDDLDGKIDVVNDNIEAINENIDSINNDVSIIQSEIDEINVGVNHLHKLGTKSFSDFYTAQGGVYIGNDTLVCAFANAAQDEIALKKINYKNGLVLAENSDQRFGHAQSIAYNEEDEELYLALYSQTGIAVVNASTLSLKRLIDTEKSYLNVSFDNESKLIYANRLDNYGQFDVIDPSTDYVVDSYVITNSIVANATKNDATLINGIFRFLTTSSIIFYDKDNQEIVKNSYIDRSLDNAASITKMEFCAFIDEESYVIGYIVTGAANVGAGTTFMTGFALFNPKENYKIPLKSATGDSAMQANVYVDYGNSNYNADGTLENPFKSTQEALNVAVANNFSNLRIRIDSATDNEIFYVEGCMTREIIIAVKVGITASFTGIVVRNGVNVKFISNVTLTARDISNYFNNALGKCYYALDGNSKLNMAGVTYDDNEIAGVYTDYNCELSCLDINPIDYTKCFNRGVVKSKRLRFANSMDKTMQSDADMTVGDIHNISFAPSGSPYNASSVTIPCPITGGMIIGTLANSNHFVIPCFCGAVTNLITQVGSDSVQVSVANTSIRGFDATVSCATSNINFARFISFG